MSEDWGQVADDYEEDDHILIGNVDCTRDHSKQLCKEFKVTGYPTLLYGDITALETYGGTRELGDLRDVVEDHLQSPLCGVQTPQYCDFAKRQAIEDLQHKGLQQLDKEIKDYEKKVQDLENRKDRFVKMLRQRYQKAQKDRDKKKTKAEEEANLDLIRSILKLKEEEEARQEGIHDEF